jgi:hypothetical protein
VAVIDNNKENETVTNLQNIRTVSRFSDGGQTRHTNLEDALAAALVDASHPNAANANAQTTIWADRPLDGPMDVALATMAGHRFCVATVSSRGEVLWYQH